MSDTTLSVKEVAERLKVSPHSVLALIHSGALAGSDVSLKPGGRPRWRILADDLDAFLQRRMHQAAPKRRRRRPKMAPLKRYF